MGKISKRAQQRAYTPVSEEAKSKDTKGTFVPNEEPPEGASTIDKAKRQAKIDDAKKKSKLLRDAEKEKEEETEK